MVKKPRLTKQVSRALSFSYLTDKLDWGFVRDHFGVPDDELVELEREKNAFLAELRKYELSKNQADE